MFIYFSCLALHVKKAVAPVGEIVSLLEKARADPKHARIFVRRAKRLAMHHRYRLPAQWRRRLCKGCDAFLVVGRNCRVRFHEGKAVYRCLECNGIMRYVYRRKK